MRISKNARIDYGKYLITALNGETLHRAIAYGVQIDQEATNFILALKNIGYDPKYKKARIINDVDNTSRPSIPSTSWSIGMAMDVVKNIRYMDHVILGFNDPDLVDLVLWIKDQGIKVTIYSINVHKDLRMAADNYREIQDDILEERE